MINRVILFAQYGEAQATIAKLQAQAIPESIAPIWSEGNIPTCYRYEKGYIVLTSIGIHSAITTLAKYIHQIDEVWNIGFAGTLKEDTPLGTLVEIDQVGKYTPLPVNLDARSIEIVENAIPPLFLPNRNSKIKNGARLISSDFPIHDQQLRQTLSHSWDLVDMEGYGIANLSLGLNKPCRLWKIVSDFASRGGRELIRKNRTYYSEMIADFLHNLQ